MGYCVGTRCGEQQIPGFYFVIYPLNWSALPTIYAICRLHNMYSNSSHKHYNSMKMYASRYPILHHPVRHRPLSINCILDTAPIGILYPPHCAISVSFHVPSIGQNGSSSTKIGTNLTSPSPSTSSPKSPPSFMRPQITYSHDNIEGIP